MTAALNWILFGEFLKTSRRSAADFRLQTRSFCYAFWGRRKLRRERRALWRQRLRLRCSLFQASLEIFQLLWWNDQVSFWLITSLALKTHPNTIRRDPCSRTSVQCIRPYTRSCRELQRLSWQRSMWRHSSSTTLRKLLDIYTYGMWYLVLD